MVHVEFRDAGMAPKSMVLDTMPEDERGWLQKNAKSYWEVCFREGDRRGRIIEWWSNTSEDRDWQRGSIRERSAHGYKLAGGSAIAWIHGLDVRSSWIADRIYEGRTPEEVGAYYRKLELTNEGVDR